LLAHEELLLGADRFDLCHAQQLRKRKTAIPATWRSLFLADAARLVETAQANQRHFPLAYQSRPAPRALRPMRFSRCTHTGADDEQWLGCEAVIPEQAQPVSTSLRFLFDSFCVWQKENVAAPASRRRDGSDLAPAASTRVCAAAVVCVAMLLLDRYGQTDRARRAGAIVVLGAAVNAYGLPGPSLRARTLHAVQLYRRDLAPVIIFTGGVGKNHLPSRGVAAALAMRRGVPRSAIFSEETSLTLGKTLVTRLRFAATSGVKTFIVVSDLIICGERSATLPRTASKPTHRLQAIVKHGCEYS
jgi:hypothetical protein